MVLPCKDVIATYNSNGDNIDITSDIKAINGLFFNATTGESVNNVMLTSKNTGQVLVSKNTGNVLNSGALL